MNIIELTDLKAKRDVFHEYTDTLRVEKVPIVIDNGSYKCRVGWSSCTRPILEFRNLIAKPRKDRKKDSAELPVNPMFQTGNDILNIEAVRMQLKTQFDRNVVTHYYNQEHIFDYIFAHLNIDNDGTVPHPIVLTEAIGNPNYCRQQLNELLFECYGVPSLTYGIDSLFSLKHNNKQQHDALILSFGYHATHIVPVLDGRMQVENVRRINAGGFHIISYLYRLMQMKYPVHLNAITVSRMEALLHQYGSVSFDYQEAVKHWSRVEYYTQNVKKIQLPYSVPITQSSTLNAEQRIERRKELGRRLIESNARRAREKKLEDDQQLQAMLSVRQLYELGEIDNFQKALKKNKLNDLQALDKIITTVRCRMERAKQKFEATAEGVVSTTPKEKTPTIAKPPSEISLENWITSVKDRRSEILKRKHIRKTRRQELAKRHTAAAQERMRIISLLARTEKGADEFGIDDNDWNVYKVINRDNDSDSDAENDKIVEYDNILKNYDPNFDESPTLSTVSDEHYQLHLGVESMRALELLFQPSLIGNSETGLAELINFVLKLFSSQEQQRLANNVFMTGGCAMFTGLKERLSKELLEMRPFQSSFNIYKAEIPELDAWLGGIDFANSNDFVDYITTKKDYEENGPEFFKTHCFSNCFFPTPKYN